MKDKIISFETAKLAKDKGFNETCTKHYNTEGKLLNFSGYDVMMKLNINNRINFVNNGTEESERPKSECTAFTQSLLKKWLRETYEIYVNTRHDLNPKGTDILYYTNWGFIRKNEKNKAYSHHGGYDEFNEWNVYEDAFEYGLIQALNLIPD